MPLLFLTVLTFYDPGVCVCVCLTISLPSFFQSIKIRLGVFQPTIKNNKEQTRNYSLTVPHPDFNMHTLEHDLLMIKLSKAAALTTRVGTIAIALEPLALNDSCFIPTWRWNEYKNRKCLALRASSWGKPGRMDVLEGNRGSEVTFLTLERLLSGPHILRLEAET